MKNRLLFVFPIILFFFACQKESVDNPDPVPIVNKVPAKVFSNLVFSPQTPFFATDGSMSQPVDMSIANTPDVISRIDITFIYNNDYLKAGFFDPIARSKVWYWDYHQLEFLSKGVETRFYVSSLNKYNFDSAAKDESKIATYFSSMELVHHSIYPKGSCIGGRNPTPTDDWDPNMGEVFGFINIASGKRGLIYFRTDQSHKNWPSPAVDLNTKVDILREN